MLVTNFVVKMKIRDSRASFRHPFGVSENQRSGARRPPTSRRRIASPRIGARTSSPHVDEYLGFFGFQTKRNRVPYVSLRGDV